MAARLLLELELSSDPKVAFKEIGEQMTAWLSSLRQRSLDHNQGVNAQLAKIPRGWNANQRDRDLQNALERSLVAVQSMIWLKGWVSHHGGSLAPVLAGSPKMDTSAAV